MCSVFRKSVIDDFSGFSDRYYQQFERFGNSGKFDCTCYYIKMILSNSSYNAVVLCIIQDDIAKIRTTTLRILNNGGGT